ncbi:unnamed protein product [marine sediment metagenome]|uniref:Uncharacterized protein n=1 Tax=marine sediment metagenome TaxID=412755 RepID=X1MR30_9ZZZZ
MTSDQTSQFWQAGSQGGKIGQARRAGVTAPEPAEREVMDWDTQVIQTICQRPRPGEGSYRPKPGSVNAPQ